MGEPVITGDSCIFIGGFRPLRGLVFKPQFPGADAPGSGNACAIYQDKVFRNLTCNRIECDEIWSFVHAKEGHLRPELQGMFGYGDVYTWVAIDADTKLIPCWNVGRRDAQSGMAFVKDLGERIKNRFQLSTDGFKLYLSAVEETFGSEIDYGMVVKIYGVSEDDEHKRYSPAKCIGCDKEVIMGNPDPELTRLATLNGRTSR